MKVPKNLSITIEWTDEVGNIEKVIYGEDDIDCAETHIGLLTGTICQGDLEP